MTTDRQKRIIGECSAEEFVGRTSELAELLAHARSRSGGGVNVLSSPGLGASEFLRQTYDRLFTERSGPIPFYFEIRRSDLTAQASARRFAREFLAQVVAYRRDDPALINSPLETFELAELALPSDGKWIQQIADLCGDDGLSVRACLSGPSRAASTGSRIFVIIDALEATLYLEDGERLLNELGSSFLRTDIGYVFGARRHFKFNHQTRKSIDLEPFTLAESGELSDLLSAALNVAINDQTRDLLGVQLNGFPGRIRSLFEAAAAGKLDLNSFRQFGSVYSEEVLSGQIGNKFDAALGSASSDPITQTRIIEFLNDALSSAGNSSPELWRTLFDIPDMRFEKMIEILRAEEIIEINSNLIEVADADIVRADCIKTRYMRAIRSHSYAAVKADLVAETLKRAPHLMARLYRRSSSLGLQNVLSRFDCQNVPSALFDYARFRDLYKGLGHKEIVAGLTDDADRLTLPQIILVDFASSFFPAISAVSDDERVVVGTGFNESKYTDEDQIAWLVAEIDSKLEAGADLASEWCDRLEQVAASSDLGRTKIWLIAPEGFTPQAINVLIERGAFGSSRQQAILLNRFLDPMQNSDGAERANEYEIVVPMGEDTELIAAHAVEEVARRHHFPQKAINQIKTALVEACINAVEHSLSPDRKIYQKFAVDDDKINITVSNRGIRLADASVPEATPAGGRRGWGLSLMKGLMDEVKIEQVDDGTRIRMTKYLKAREN